MLEQRFRVAESARKLGVSARFISDEMRRGRLEYARLGRCVTISERTLAEYIAARQVQTTSKAGVLR